MVAVVERRVRPDRPRAVAAAASGPRSRACRRRTARAPRPGRPRGRPRGLPRRAATADQSDGGRPPRSSTTRGPRRPRGSRTRPRRPRRSSRAPARRGRRRAVSVAAAEHDRGRHVGRRGLRHQQHHVGRRVVLERPHCQPALRPATAADRSRPPTPITCDTPSPHRSSRTITSWAPVPAAATTPTCPAADRVGEPEAAAAEPGGARARSHHQPADAGGVLLQLDLLVDAHVVAEQQDVESGGQGVVGLERRRTSPGPTRWRRWRRRARRRAWRIDAGLGAPVPRQSSSRTGTAPARPARGRVATSVASLGAHRRARDRSGCRRPAPRPVNPCLPQVVQVGRAWPSPRRRTRRPRTGASCG